MGGAGKESLCVLHTFESVTVMNSLAVPSRQYEIYWGMLVLRKRTLNAWGRIHSRNRSRGDHCLRMRVCVRVLPYTSAVSEATLAPKIKKTRPRFHYNLLLLLKLTRLSRAALGVFRYKTLHFSVMLNFNSVFCQICLINCIFMWVQVLGAVSRSPDLGNHERKLQE